MPSTRPSAVSLYSTANLVTCWNRSVETLRIPGPAATGTPALPRGSRSQTTAGIPSASVAIAASLIVFIALSPQDGERFRHEDPAIRADGLGGQGELRRREGVAVLAEIKRYRIGVAGLGLVEHDGQN